MWVGIIIIAMILMAFGQLFESYDGDGGGLDF